MADQNLARQFAQVSALLRLMRGEASQTELAAQLTTNFGAAAAAAFDGEASGIVVTAPPLGVQTGKTGIVSLLSTGVHAIDLPVIPGKRTMLILSAFVVQARTGTATGTLTYKVGNNAGNDNLIASTNVGAAPFNATTFSLPFSLAGPQAGGMPDMTAGLNLEITAALAGASVLTGRFGLLALYV